MCICEYGMYVYVGAHVCLSVCMLGHGGWGYFQEQHTLFCEDSRVSTKVSFNVLQIYYYKIIFERLNIDPNELFSPTGSLEH